MNACHTGIDHVTDAGNRQRGFSHICRQHDAAPIGVLKHAVLLGIRQARVQRQNFRVRGVVLAQRFIAIANFAFARQEHQHIALAGIEEQLIDGLEHGVLNRHRVITLVEEVLGPIAHFNRISAARHLDDRCAPEVLGKTLRIDGRRGDDDFQVRAPGRELLHIAQQKIDVETALVRLVDDQRVVVP